MNRFSLKYNTNFPDNVHTTRAIDTAPTHILIRKPDTVCCGHTLFHKHFITRIRQPDTYIYHTRIGCAGARGLGEIEGEVSSKDVRLWGVEGVPGNERLPVRGLAHRG